MKSWTKILLIVSAFLLIAVLFFPIWHINLFAPQYPEGIYMQIWTSKITGDVRNINLLNHYIGMHKIIPSEIPLLQYLSGGLVVLAIGALITAFVKSIWGIRLYVFIVSACSAGSLYDFYRWGYKFGHELDPRASIKIPGMTYQPPLIGYKTILNITAWSLPGIGGYCFFTAFALMLTCLYLREKKR